MNKYEALGRALFELMLSAEKDWEEPSAVPIYEDCEFFRATDGDIEAVRKWYRKNNLDVSLIPEAIEIVDAWLGGESSAAKAARKSKKSHHRRLFAGWCLSRLTERSTAIGAARSINATAQSFGDRLRIRAAAMEQSNED